jgi:hypothetical protein
MVDVHPAGRDVAERPLPGPDHPGDETGDGEGQHEGSQGEKQGQLPRLDEVLIEPVTHATTPVDPPLRCFAAFRPI